MKAFKLFAIAGLLTAFCSAPGAKADEMSGREIMDKVKELQTTQDETESQDMQLIDTKGRVKEREVTTYTMKDENDQSRTLIRFHAPSDIAGTGLLTWEQKDRDDDQWLYLPATKKSKRIVSGSRKEMFMGTDFTYGDLRPEDLDAHNYNVAGSEAIDGKDCFIIDAVPKTAQEIKDSGYFMRKLWVRKDIYFVVQKKFFDDNKKLEKVETADDLKNVSNSIYRADSITMKNFKKKHKTVLKSKGREINKGLSVNLFTVRELEKGQ